MNMINPWGELREPAAMSQPYRIVPFPGVELKYPAAVPPQTRKIIPFPGTAGKAPEEREPIPESGPSFAEHCAVFKGVDFGNKYTRGKIVWALWSLKIHSLEELAETPAAKILTRHRIGPKTLERIRAALESRGFTLGGDWDAPV